METKVEEGMVQLHDCRHLDRNGLASGKEEIPAPLKTTAFVAVRVVVVVVMLGFVSRG